ncbi:glutaredoxin 3 [Geminocystis sp. NIES-3709]|uniref:glutaredoxin 3 n=1 Tax=Geminocystis sp. NIES-3709 TaxID=1617448 RepID=UPI0005FC994A|nr:glutaredoxin 3 [Geminocystis sp. NIES-3709]BAQ63410.1 glutaredoxin 3 [Geminocystis sp. NIES-3709]
MLNLISKIFGNQFSYIQAKVEIYTWQTCPYCIKAKWLLWLKGCDFQEYKIDGDNTARKLMIDRANGKKTLPQIFINNISIGGCDNLYRLDQEKKLDILLSESL